MILSCSTGSSGSDALNLYSCGGEGGVLQHNAGHLMDDAVDVNALIMKTNNLKVGNVSRSALTSLKKIRVIFGGNMCIAIAVFIISRSQNLMVFFWDTSVGPQCIGGGEKRKNMAVATLEKSIVKNA